MSSENKAYPEQQRMSNAYIMVSPSFPGVASIEMPHQRKPAKTANSRIVLVSFLFMKKVISLVLLILSK